jgi:capsid assembly protein
MSDIKAFVSPEEVISAMRDPKYDTDEAYRQHVLARLDATEIPAPSPVVEQPPIPISPSWLQGFRSDVELTEAMRHPRYQTDSAYRADVAAAIAVSDPGLLGISAKSVGGMLSEQIDPDAAKAAQDKLTIERRTTGYPDIPVTATEKQ